MSTLDNPTEVAASTTGPAPDSKLAGVHPIVQIIQIILSFAGCVVAGVLWWAHLANVSLPCTSDGGCETIAASSYAHLHLFGKDIPVAFVGLIGYIILFTASMFKYVSETDAARKALNAIGLLVTIGGFGYSWYLQYVAHFVIGAFCVYCFTSACIMTVLFGLFIAEWRKLQSANGS